MKVAVLGAGLMGKEVARDLVKSDKVEKVYLADLDVGQTTLFAELLKSDKLEVLHLDANDDAELKWIMAKADVVINALFYTFNEKVARMAIEVGVHSVDLGGHIGGATNAVLELSEDAKEKGVTLIPDLGVAPGMINILTGYGASKLNSVKSIKIFVGGIPVEKEPPLDYNIVFSLEGVFDHYTDSSHVIRGGKLQEIASLSEIEKVYFDGFTGLEAFHTSGGLSTLAQTFPNVNTLEYKTIRYQGHAEKFQLLVDLGLTNKETTVNLDGQVIKARDVLREVLQTKMSLGNKSDAVLLRVIVSGEKSEELVSYEYELIIKKDKETNETAMALATANTISVVAQLVGDGTISKRGVYPPEKVVPGEKYMEEMKKRGVSIKETMHRSTNIVKG
ncbi:saccharopine dehydrogenase C-terminal domain-containing protein [Viridibacillus sp. FSL R5-0477]|uniref:L-lysine dehydrogenase n=1 Tax=Viridibacillus arenosi FSL R5-213 TaxID=1227360 RepID=W4F3B5_9BACL|nr:MULTISPECIES: saccharopine dehydrogenase C-terminal domain-containing protein [Viridibacillus]ETT87343.1 L-lysine dehydrogenase [Viridibacillus arenosi FSL R5-213]OMC82415.1 saccharopine dehydrogenase [Viridibacillus sp. FSL H8-0123]OMC87836.1 saccharopine dehydrogenase [Viridibacillus sp. FSL H7-0596]OMC91386.1 saccharopine dehydrogenase [Viridibacillus arenosi]